MPNIPQSDKASLNLISMVKEQLEQRIKREVIDQVVKDQMAEFEKTCKTKAKELVDKFAITEVRSLTDMITLRDELHIFIQWDDKKENN